MQSLLQMSQRQGKPTHISPKLQLPGTQRWWEVGSGAWRENGDSPSQKGLDKSLMLHIKKKKKMIISSCRKILIEDYAMPGTVLGTQRQRRGAEKTRSLPTKVLCFTAWIKKVYLGIHA